VGLERLACGQHSGMRVTRLRSSRIPLSSIREIEAMTGQRRELRKRGRPRKQDGPSSADAAGQGDLPL